MEVTTIQEKHLAVMQKTMATFVNIIGMVEQEQATTWRDGSDGWTILEVLCHVRDFDAIFRQRAEMILRLQTPQLQGHDHLQMAADNHYNDQNLKSVLAELAASREQTFAFFNQLQADDWQHVGIHPEFGQWSLTRAVTQVGLHDIDHIEQITRIITDHVLH